MMIMMVMVMVILMMMVIVSHSFRDFASRHFLGHDIFWEAICPIAFNIVSNELGLGKLKQLAGLEGKGVIGSIGISDP